MIKNVLTWIALAITAVTGAAPAAPAAPAGQAQGATARGVCCTTTPAPPGGWTVWPIGDSITQGDGPAAEGGFQGGYRAQLDTMWQAPHRFVGTLTDTGGLHHDGHSGWAIREITAQVDGWSAAIGGPGAVDVILVHLGANDNGQRRPGEQMLADMGTLLDRLHALQPQAVVAVAMIPHFPHNDADQWAQVDVYNAGLRGLLTGRGPWTRLADQRAAHISTDGVHPDAAGYAQMAYVWLPLLPGTVPVRGVPSLPAG